MRLNKREWIAFFIISFIFILVEAKGLAIVEPGDENVYYYMAKSITEGKLPYRDFFYAHPPLHIFILAAVIKIFGVNFTILKSVNLLALLIASFFLYKMSLELFKNYLNDEHAYHMSILSLILLLFSFEVMFNATFSMGVAFASMFVIASFYFIFNKKYFTGGFIGGIAGLARFYAVVPMIAILAFFFIKKFQEKQLKDFFRMLLGFFAAFGIVIIALIILFGSNFINPTIKYHLLKLKLPNQRITVYKNVAIENWALLLAFLLSFFIKNKKRFRIFFSVIFVYLIFLLALNVPAEFYFSLIFPFMAIIGAYSFVALLRKIKINPIKYGLLILMSAIFLWSAIADVLFIEKIVFSEFTLLNPLTAKLSSTNPQLKIFGDDSIVPLIGLMTNRSIALNYIDANEMRFTSGLSNFYLFKDELDGVNLSYIIFRKNRGLHQISNFRDYTETRCSFENEYQDIVQGTFLLYKC